MKSILLYANQDAGLEARLQAALDLARAVRAHITLLQVRPLPLTAANDGMAGLAGYDLIAQMEQEYSAQATSNRQAVEQRLAAEGVQWDWIDDRGVADRCVLEQSSLSDVAILSLAEVKQGLRDPVSLVGSVAVHGSTPVLAVPPTVRGLRVGGTALAAWNGSLEAAHALRQAIPLLKLASRIVVTCLGDIGEGALPGESAARYLDRHGLKVEVVERPVGADVAETLLALANELDAGYLVAGAYGHSRVREFLMGGVTRSLLAKAKLPLLLAH